jgi:hypothetical protein
MAAPRSPFLTRLGCGHLALVLLVSCLLLVLNSLIVSNLLRTGWQSLPDALRDRRYVQAIVFIGPVLLLVVQWWAWDVALDWLWPTRSRLAPKD